MQRNFKAPLMAALGELGLNDGSGVSGARMTFTHVRQRTGHRRVKLWFANDVWNLSAVKQRRLERALRKHYAGQYLGGYFIDNQWGKSFCVVLDRDQ